MSIHATDAERDWYGFMIAGSQFGGVVLSVSLLAIQFFMVVYGTAVYASTPISKRKGRFKFIVFSCVILVASAINTLSDAWICFRVVYTGGPTGQTYLAAYNQIYVYQEDQRVRIAGNAMLLVSFAVGDALLLWRCAILWNERKWVVSLPAITATGAVVLFGVAIPPYGYTNHPRVRAIIASAALSVATNIMVTSLIVLRLAMTWFSVRKSMPDHQGSRMYTDIAAILVESAAPLAFFGICFIVSTVAYYLRPPTTVRGVGRALVLSWFFDLLYYTFCALSPQMIIFRVTVGHSWKNVEESKSGIGTFSQPLEFAREGSDTRSSALTESA